MTTPPKDHAAEAGKKVRKTLEEQAKICRQDKGDMMSYLPNENYFADETQSAIDAACAAKDSEIAGCVARINWLEKQIAKRDGLYVANLNAAEQRAEAAEAESRALRERVRDGIEAMQREKEASVASGHYDHACAIRDAIAAFRKALTPPASEDGK